VAAAAKAAKKAKKAAAAVVVAVAILATVATDVTEATEATEATALFSLAAVTTAIHMLSRTMASIIATWLPKRAMCVILSAFASHSIKAPATLLHWVASSEQSYYLHVFAVFASLSASAVEVEAMKALIPVPARGQAVGVTTVQVTAVAIVARCVIVMLITED